MTNTNSPAAIVYVIRIERSQVLCFWIALTPGTSLVVFVGTNDFDNVSKNSDDFGKINTKLEFRSAAID
jgi:hypothetical protein